MRGPFADEGVTMSAVDKMKIVAEEIAGKTREVVGKVTGDEAMIAEGIAEQIDAEAKLAAGHDHHHHDD